MSKELRKRDFKIGQLHGKSQAKDKVSEADIQRKIFLSQRIKLRREKRKHPCLIRIFGYEIPLENSTRKCVDIMGYDKEHNLYLIELKKEKSPEKLEEIKKQIDGYEGMIKEILPDIEKEFEEEFFFHIKFKDIKKMILAPREFYRGEKRKGALAGDGTIKYAYFADKDIHKHNLNNAVNIHLVEKMRCR